MRRGWWVLWLGLIGTALGFAVSGLWWHRLDTRLCTLSSSPCGDIPPGDATLLLGGLAGRILGLLVDAGGLRLWRTTGKSDLEDETVA